MIHSAPQCHTLHLLLPLFIPSSLFPVCSRNGLTQVISWVTIFSFASVSDMAFPLTTVEQKQGFPPQVPALSKELEGNHQWQRLLWVAWSSHCLAQLSHSKVQRQSTYKYTIWKIYPESQSKIQGSWHLFFKFKKASWNLLQHLNTCHSQIGR